MTPSPTGPTTPLAPVVAGPVARVLVDVPLAHLDRPFDYLVPAAMSSAAVPGCRVRVRFAGQDVNGFVVERVESSGHPGRLAPLRRVVSPEPVLSPQIARLSASVAARYAGTRADVLRLAVPPRHAAAEKSPSTPAAPAPVDIGTTEQPWSRYRAGASFVRRLAEGGSPRSVWSALPGQGWAEALAQAAAATHASGRGAVVCLPDGKDVARVDKAMCELLGTGRHVVLTADLGPAARYRAFLAVSRGAVRMVVGTRAAAFAPVHDLGLVAIWDEGDDSYAEPRAPYPHAREVLLLRAHEEECAALLGGFARTAEAQHLLESGWARELVADRSTVRAVAPQVSVTGATDADLRRDPLARATRLPKAVFQVIREGLRAGPVLLQTPRQGYLAGLACDRCRSPARCPQCAGPLALEGAGRFPACRWCGRPESSWTCPVCGGEILRAPVLGDRRTAEEIGRAFPLVPVRNSSGDRVLADVPATASIVVATPGAEPHVEGGYPAVVLLDTWLPLARHDLRSGEESLRRWMNAAALARSAAAGGRVLAAGDSAHPVLQALLRWDPAGHAARELADRLSARLPPAFRVATVSGDGQAVASAVATLRLPAGAEVLGPIPVEQPTRQCVEHPYRQDPEAPEVRVVLRAPRALGGELSRCLLQMRGVRDARKLPPVRVQVDPVRLG